MGSSRTAGAVGLVPTLVLVGALSGAAYGTRENASPKKWVSVFCSSVVSWERSVKSDTAKFENVVLGLEAPDRNLKKARRLMVGFLAGIVAETETMVDEVSTVGPPAIRNGAKLQAGVIDGFTQLIAVFRSAKRSAQTLPTSNAASFARQAKALGNRIQSGTNRIGTAFTALGKYSTPTLDAAAKKDPDCQKLS
jgi:hypothetical protein